MLFSDLSAIQVACQDKWSMPAIYSQVPPCKMDMGRPLWNYGEMGVEIDHKLDAENTVSYHHGNLLEMICNCAGPLKTAMKLFLRIACNKMPSKFNLGLTIASVQVVDTEMVDRHWLIMLFGHCPWLSIMSTLGCYLKYSHCPSQWVKDYSPVRPTLIFPEI